jgi:thiol:disulfide interchange protein DsbD
MKTLNFIILFWLFTIGIAHAEVPKAEVTLTALTNGQYSLSLNIPKDHHAYLDKGDESIYIPVNIALDEKLSAAGFSIEKLQKPAGVYDSSVKATVLRDKNQFTLILAQSTTSKKIEATQLSVQYQLCNELTHVCYRPQMVKLDLNLPVVSAATAAQIAPNPTVESSFMESLVQLFERNKQHTFIMFALMFMAGLFSVATPCVYPMLPITSMFIVRRAGGVSKAEKYHALVYLIGIIGTYMMLGLIAGMTGGAFNTFMQSAFVNILFALFFAFFGIALLGFYELGFMQNEVNNLDQNSAQIKGLTGTWLMGCVAGLVISPCVGPIVFALLLQVADNIAEKSAALVVLNQSLGFWDKFIISAQGSVMMAGFGLGVGLPFFLVSVLKFNKLPRSGYWMNKIKYAFGLMILYFAYVYLSKGLGVLGVEQTTVLVFVLGIVGVWTAVVHCNILSLLPQDAQPNEKMYRFLGVISLIVGVWLVVASLGQMPLVHSTNNQVTAPKTIISGIQQESGIAWHRSFKEAQKVAQQTGKPLFIDFYASWCANCAAFKAEAANNAVLNQALREKAIAVKLVDKEPEFEAFRENPEHRPLKIGLPYFAILSPEGKVLVRHGLSGDG